MLFPARLGLLLALAALAGAGEAAAQDKAAPAGGTPAAIAKGDTIFHKTGLCYACHGSNAEGTIGPNLTDAEWLHGDGSYDMIVATVTSGIPAEKAKKGVPMPAKGGSSITDEEVKAVAAYVYSLSHK
ncbi:MAG: c-type cytochrome [Gemmatimonadales bacterium]|nr:c-type cytochrome [Gemmatimonadales bacterium]